MRPLDVERHAGENAEREDEAIERMLGDTADNRHVLVVTEYPAPARQDQQPYGS
jgi:hypothetical protein